MHGSIAVHLSNCTREARNDDARISHDAHPETGIERYQKGTRRCTGHGSRLRPYVCFSVRVVGYERDIERNRRGIGKRIPDEGVPFKRCEQTRRRSKTHAVRTNPAQTPTPRKISIRCGNMSPCRNGPIRDGGHMRNRFRVRKLVDNSSVIRLKSRIQDIPNGTRIVIT